MAGAGGKMIQFYCDSCGFYFPTSYGRCPRCKEKTPGLAAAIKKYTLSSSIVIIGDDKDITIYANDSCDRFVIPADTGGWEICELIEKLEKPTK
jgi:hypothetical protein